MLTLVANLFSLLSVAAVPACPPPPSDCFPRETPVYLQPYDSREFTATIPSDWSASDYGTAFVAISPHNSCVAMVWSDAESSTSPEQLTRAALSKLRLENACIVRVHAAPVSPYAGALAWVEFTLDLQGRRYRGVAECRIGTSDAPQLGSNRDALGCPPSEMGKHATMYDYMESLRLPKENATCRIAITTADRWEADR